MAKTLEISIKCEHCNQWFPSPFFLKTENRLIHQPCLQTSPSASIAKK